jgi:hypothetical protein
LSSSNLDIISSTLFLTLRFVTLSLFISVNFYIYSCLSDNVSTVLINSYLRTFVYLSKENVIPILSNTNFSNILISNSSFKISFDKVFWSGSLICKLKNLNNSMTSRLFTQNNGNLQEMVTCNKCRWNFGLSEFEKGCAINGFIYL